MEDELLDWEVLHSSDTESTDSITSNEKSRSSSVIDDGMILSDHFSATDLSQSGLIEPGDSSRVDYGSEPPVVVDLSDACVRNELGIYDSKIGISSNGGEVRLSDFEADDKSKCLSETDDLEVSVEEPIEDLSKSWSDSRGNELVSGNSEIVNGQDEIVFGESKCLFKSDDLEVGDGRQVENQSGVEESIEDLSKSWSDSGGNELVSVGSEIVNGQEEIVSDSGVVSTEEVGAVRCGDESESKSREIVWWKMPFVLFKYSVFKIGPVWSVSMAAAVMGLVLLGRRLYNMKKKAQRFHLKVTIDDKKVSRVMSQAARLNEVFTEVRRVPVIRSALPSPVSWPVLSLR